MPSYRPVNALVRGLEVLRATSQLEGRATVGEIHRHTNLDKATIVRMLETLVYAGYVVRDDEGRRYQITGKTLRLSVGYDGLRSVGTILAPILDDFRTAVGWPSDVGVFDNDAMVVVETSREPGPVFLNRLPGYRAPILGTSLGLVYLAHCAQAVRSEALQRVAADPAPWNELARDPVSAEKAFARIRRHRYATMHPRYCEQEYEGRISSVGVPIAQNGRVFATLNVLYLVNALAPKKAVQTLLPPLEEAAARMAGELAERWAD
ncbi:MAG: helix-turn-helix domain-containing protein [Gammaproteobacteria bacterium]